MKGYLSLFVSLLNALLQLTFSNDIVDSADPTNVGNLLPKEPVVGDDVVVRLRLSDNDDMVVFADVYEAISDEDSVYLNVVMHTIGSLCEYDPYSDDLLSLCALEPHRIEGKVTKIVSAERFEVEWMVQENSDCSLV